jgi:4-hydroxybenzoyl-CoA thioesterase
MLINSRTIRIQWGDCDPMGIVFFPRYLAIFDDSTAMLFERALGMTKFELMRRQKLSGFPLVDLRARFLIPSRFGDDVVVESGVSEFRRSSFDVQHRLRKAAELAVECVETRVWTFKDADGRMKGLPIPEEIRAKFA